MSREFDLTVIGGGPGGYEAAIRAAQLGLKVAIVEEREMGGTCLNRGCIPTKSLLHSAEVYQTAKHSAEFGIITKDVYFDYLQIVSRKDTVVKKLRAGIEYLVKSNGIAIFRGRGKIKDRNTIEIVNNDGQGIHTGRHAITADKLIIATGSRPLKPTIPGIGGSRILDSDGVLSLEACPEKVVIIGGGVIGVEFAALFNTLGKDVAIIEMADTVLPGIDLEISMLLRRSMEKKGIKIFTGSGVTSVLSEPKAACYFENGGKEQCEEGDIIITAIGRKPNSENLGLENAGIETEKGFIKVNEYMETSIKGVYAIGDITGRYLLAHLASAQGLVAAANAAGKCRKMNYTVVPGCIYTNPEIAAVGLTEAGALKRGYSLKIGRFPVSANGRSMIMGENEGLVKVITDKDTGEILGTHIMGPRATDMISEICLAMKLESTGEEIADTIHPHPTVSEIIMEAVHDIDGLCVNKLKK